MKTAAEKARVYRVIENGPDAFDYVLREFTYAKCGESQLQFAKAFAESCQEKYGYLGYGYTVDFI